MGRFINLYFLTYIIGMMKATRIRWAGHSARTREMRNTSEPVLKENEFCSGSPV
jgi:hypothetical protein